MPTNSVEWSPEHTKVVIIYLVCLFVCVNFAKSIIKKRSAKWTNEVIGEMVSSSIDYRDYSLEPSYSNSTKYVAKYEFVINGKKYYKKLCSFDKQPTKLKFFYYKSGKDAIPEGYCHPDRKIFKAFMYVIMPFILFSIIYYGILGNP